MLRVAKEFNTLFRCHRLELQNNFISIYWDEVWDCWVHCLNRKIALSIRTDGFPSPSHGGFRINISSVHQKLFFALKIQAVGLIRPESIHSSRSASMMPIALFKESTNWGRSLYSLNVSRVVHKYIARPQTVIGRICLSFRTAFFFSTIQEPLRDFS